VPLFLLWRLPHRRRPLHTHAPGAPTANTHTTSSAARCSPSPPTRARTAPPPGACCSH